jgi:hypothetical protein
MNMAFRCKDLMMDVVPSPDSAAGYVLCGVASCSGLGKSTPAPLAPDLPESEPLCPLASCGSKSVPPSPDSGEEEPKDSISTLAFLQGQLRQALGQPAL